ncbi:hypothetical protein [Woeseia oceani]|nr:hypothetical protein [Woeseia oceani]
MTVTIQPDIQMQELRSVPQGALIQYGTRYGFRVPDGNDSAGRCGMALYSPDCDLFEIVFGSIRESALSFAACAVVLDIDLSAPAMRISTVAPPKASLYMAHGRPMFVVTYTDDEDFCLLDVTNGDIMAPDYNPTWSFPKWRICIEDKSGKMTPLIERVTAE